jgi:plastocyanin
LPFELPVLRRTTVSFAVLAALAAASAARARTDAHHTHTITGAALAPVDAGGVRPDPGTAAAPTARHRDADRRARPRRRDDRRRHDGGRRHHRHHRRHAARARAAGDPTDTIADFSFAPATITVHAGDTVTWVNDGPSAHTATAGNGSFNTGVLKKGQSASHTFTQSGTYAYICAIHPFMHGTVVVLADTSSSTSTSGSDQTGPGQGGSGHGTTTTTTPGSTTFPSTTGSSASGAAPSTGGDASQTPVTAPGTLPLTGLDVGLIGLLGAVLGAAGAVLRRVSRRPRA